jgi:CheY-like chemotaxis protein
METTTNLNYFSIPFIVVDDSKNIVSFNLGTSYRIKLSFLRKPVIGQPVGEIFEQEHMANIYDELDKCLSGSPVIVEDFLIGKIVKSPRKLQLIFIPIYINVNLTYAVCLILPNLYSPDKTLLSERQSRFISHKLQAPISSLLSLSDLKNHSKLSSYEDRKIEELLKTIHLQVEKINEIIINLNFLFNTEQTEDEHPGYKKELLMQIVLIDDDPVTNMMHKILLLKYKKNASVKNFESPVEALFYITTNEPDLVFLDINMPEMNAWEFLAKLEETSFNAPIILISSSIDPNERLKAYSNKYVSEFICKPLTYEKLTTLFN